MAAVFGPNENAYFFCAPPRWHYNALPAALAAILARDKPPRVVFQLSLGPNGSWFIGYQTHEGVLHFNRHSLPAGLNTWLVPTAGKGTPRDVTTLCVALGPNESYFAWDKNGATWGNLPSQMQFEIAKRLGKKGKFRTGESPVSVAFGPDDAFVMIGRNGGACWSSTLVDQSLELVQWLRATKSKKNWYISLSPTRAGVYVLVHKTGETKACLPQSMHPAYNAFGTEFKQFMALVDAKKRQQRAQNIKSAVRIGVKVLGIAASVAAAGSNNSGGGGGGGGGGSMPVFQTGGGGGGLDMSNFWTPQQGAAMDQIQG